MVYVECMLSLYMAAILARKYYTLVEVPGAHRRRGSSRSTWWHGWRRWRDRRRSRDRQQRNADLKMAVHVRDKKSKFLWSFLLRGHSWFNAINPAMAKGDYCTPICKMKIFFMSGKTLPVTRKDDRKIAEKKYLEPGKIWSQQLRQVIMTWQIHSGQKL